MPLSVCGVCSNKSMEESCACVILLGTPSEEDAVCLRRWATLNCHSFRLEAEADSACMVVVQQAAHKLRAHKDAMRKALKRLGLTPPSSVKGWLRLLPPEEALALTADTDPQREVLETRTVILTAPKPGGQCSSRI